MPNDPEPSRDLALLSVPQVGRLVNSGDGAVLWVLADADGSDVEAVASYFRELQAAGRSPATLRSYGMDLLRWFRFLWAAEVAWDRASQTEAREFARWLQVAGKPARVHWRRQDQDSVAAGPTGPAYSAAVRAHSETVLRNFYDFHRDVGTGPILNPFPLDRSRRDRRAHAHRDPMEPARHERTGRYRPVVPSRIPRSVPDAEFNEIFARLPSHRDRALIAFYVSTGARAAELLSVTQAGVDPVVSWSLWCVRDLVVRRSCRRPATPSSGCGSTSWRWTIRSLVAGANRCGGRCEVSPGR